MGGLPVIYERARDVPAIEIGHLPIITKAYGYYPTGMVGDFLTLPQQIVAKATDEGSILVQASDEDRVCSSIPNNLASLW